MNFDDIDIKKIAIFVAIALAFSWLAGNYNGLVRTQNDVLAQQGQIEEAYQRRIELIPDLVKSVQKYTEHEEKVIESITNARTSLQEAINSGDLEAMDEKSSELTIKLNEALVIIEDNPDLKASDLYIQLNDEIAGSANRISQARYKYNELVQIYNNKVLTYPGLLYAKIFGFKPYDYVTTTARNAHDYSVVKFE